MVLKDRYAILASYVVSMPLVEQQIGTIVPASHIKARMPRPMPSRLAPSLASSNKLSRELIIALGSTKTPRKCGKMMSLSSSPPRHIRDHGLFKFGHPSTCICVGEIKRRWANSQLSKDMERLPLLCCPLVLIYIFRKTLIFASISSFCDKSCLL